MSLFLGKYIVVVGELLIIEIFIRNKYIVMAKARKEGKGKKNRRNLKKRLDIIKNNIKLIQNYEKNS